MMKGKSYEAMWTRPFFVEAIDDVAEALEGLGRAGPFGLEQSPSFGRGG